MKERKSGRLTEDLELANRLEVLDVITRDLSDFEKTYTSLVVDERTSLDISLGLVRHLHQELCTTLVHVFEDVLVDDGTQVVDVRDEEVFFSLREEFVDESRVHDRVEQISVTRGVPGGFVFESGTGSGEESLLVDTRVTRLVRTRDQFHGFLWRESTRLRNSLG